MKEVFKKYPEFVDTDPRVKRPSFKSYAITHEFTELRHAGLFAETKLKGKTVLDIGACVGATGAWVLDKGAKFYHAVEVDKDLADLANKNLSKHFDKSKFKVDCISIEEFFNKNETHYDIVIAAGVIYGFFNPMDFLDLVAEVADEIIVDSVHNLVLTKYRDDSSLDHFTENAPTLYYGEHVMMKGTTMSNVFYKSLMPSIGFVKQYMADIGFKCGGINDVLNQTLPHVYAVKGRFAVNLKRSGKKKTITKGFLNAVNTTKSVSWFDDKNAKKLSETK